MPLAPVVQDFKNFIDGDGAVYTAFREMFRQAAASTAAGAAVNVRLAAAAAAAQDVGREDGAVAALAVRARETAATAAHVAATTAVAAQVAAAAPPTPSTEAAAAVAAKAQALAAAEAAAAAAVAASATPAVADATKAAAVAAAEAAVAAAVAAGVDPTEAHAEAQAAVAVAGVQVPAEIEDYEELMEVIDATLMVAPTYRPGPSAMVAGVPFYGIIARFCNTPAGYEALTHPGVNARFCAVFTEWHSFLLSPESAEVIVPEPEAGGWLSPQALDAMVQSAGGNPQLETFQDFYICDPNAEHYGFDSYDAFFVRELLPNRRAPEFPDDPVIVDSPCSSTVHKLYRNLAHTDRFYIKNTPYSLSHMLAGDARVDDFVGGTLLQSMLGSLDYHGWRSPVNGKVVGVRLISGMTHLDGVPPAPHPTYYAACLDNNRTDLDVVSRSQDFVSAISTRALIFIEAEEPIGLMCFVGVGLGEVSTCNVVVEEGTPLVKGDELGQFHFGGSTYCLIFRPGLNVTEIQQGPNGDQPLVGSKVRVGKAVLTVEKL